MRVLKLLNFKGGTRVTSNRYHFLGGTPADAAHWHTLMDAVTAAEKLVTNDITTITEAIGYAAGSDVPVASKVYSIVGTCTAAAAGYVAAGECAALVRYSTAERTSKNHPIYLFNYYHGAYAHQTGGTGDALDANMRSALETYAAAWIAGFSDGTNTYTRCGPNGQAATGATVEEWLTHRDFPYSASL